MPVDRNHVLCKYVLTDETYVLYRCRLTDKTCALHSCRHTDRVHVLHRYRLTDRVHVLHRCRHTDRVHVLHRCRHTDRVHVLHRCRHRDGVHVLHRCRHSAESVHCTDVGVCNAIIYHVGCVYFCLTATLGVLVKVVFWEPDTASLTNTPQTEAFCEVRSLTIYSCVKIICHSW
jgi:hypothetical protein